MSTVNKRKSQQRGAIIRIGIFILILIGCNMIGTRFHYLFDLTAEKRFTLSTPTKNMLAAMDDVAVIEVYLKGKFPAGFQRLSESVREKLEAFKTASNGKIVYRFIDPVEGKTDDEKAQVAQALFEKGIQAMMLNQNDEDGYQQQVMFPYALVRYKGNELAVKLLETHYGMSPAEQLNMSESLLEYKFASTLRNLSQNGKPDIAYIMGNGEAIGPGTYDALGRTLPLYYNLDTFDLETSFFIPVRYKAVIICKPTVPFDERAKFKIDQYVMRGGSVLWLTDAVHASMDSLQGSEQYLAIDYGLNLDDLLFRYGARLNPVLLEDLQCEQIPVIVGGTPEQPQMGLHHWQYFPLMQAASNHPIVSNMNLVLSVFAGTIDTVGAPGIRKTVLLTSSKYSRPTPSPVRISLAMLKYTPDPQLYHHSYSPTAVLLEGKFQSVFQNRVHPEFLTLLHDSLHYDYKAAADSDGKMIVVSDGDIFFSDFTYQEGPLEMGYWKYSGEQYANKSFILNCLEYLTDKSGILASRSKDVRLRLLDGARVKAQRSKWQMINIVVPILLVLVFASCWMFFRNRRYASPVNQTKA